MKLIILGVLAALVFVPGNASLHQDKPELIDSKEKFTRDGVVSYLTLGDKRQKIETGKLNGVDYRIYYSDGSGTFVGKLSNSLDITNENPGSYEDNWSVSCKKDLIDDQKICIMMIYDLTVSTTITDAFPKGIDFVSVGNDHYPGSDVAIRLDKKPAIKAASEWFLITKAPQVLRELKTAKHVATRYQKWPSRSYIDKSWELYGFNEAYRYLKWAIAKIK